MALLIFGSLLFFVAFLIHILIWKFRLPKNHTNILLITFILTLVAGVVLLYNFKKFSIFEYLQLTFLFISLTLAYITTYSAIEVDSPSLRIVLKIAQCGFEGLDKEVLEMALTDDILVKPRIQDLYKDKMIRLEKDRYKLTAKGIFITRIFVFYRKLLNTGKGG